MLQKSSCIKVADKCGVWSVRVFHVYRGFKHKVGLAGDFVKVSVRKTKANNWFKRGKKSKAIIIRTRYKMIKKDGSYIRTLINSSVLLKKRMTPRGDELFGPILYGFARRKFTASFSGLI